MPGKEFKTTKGGVYLDLIQSRESLRLAQEQLAKHPAWWGLPENHAPLRELLGARLLNKGGQANGIIMVSDKTVAEFTEEDEHFLRQLASITSLALQHVEAREEVEQKAKELEQKVKARTKKLAQANEHLKEYSHRITQVQEEERKRIAYELHDDTAQYLSLLKLELDALLQSGKIQDSRIMEKLEYLQKDADRAFNDVHRYSHELRPTTLEHQGLAAALEQIADDHNKLGQLYVEFNAEGMEPDLSEEVKLGFFRIAQEALNNTRKHAKAAQAIISLKFLDSQLEMSVSDNGTGFDVKEADTRSGGKGSLGLMSMQERANLVGADLKISSQPGQGTSVTLELPLKGIG